MKWVAVEIESGRIHSFGVALQDGDFSHFPTTLVVIRDVLEEVRPDTHYWDGQNFVAFPPRPSAHYDWDWTTKAWVPGIAAAKAAKMRDVLTQYRIRKYLPVIYDGKTLTVDSDSEQQLLFKIAEFAERVRMNLPGALADRVWIDGLSAYSFATDVEFRNWLGGFLLAIANRNTALLKVVRQHRIAIKDLMSIEAVEAYDVTVGWPAS